MVQTRPCTPVSRPRLSIRVCALFAITLWVPSLSGCVYRMAIQQGNFLDVRQVTQLEVGMTRSQVRFLLGTPMLPDAFNRDRWDYLYTLDLGRGEGVERQRLTVFFEGDTVARIENDGVPTETAANAPAP